VGSNGGTDQTWEMMEAADLVIFMGCPCRFNNHSPMGKTQPRYPRCAFR